MRSVSWERIEHIVQRHRIIYGVMAALIAAMLLTVISMALYVSSGASRLDLSRPGYERLRSEVKQGESEETFSPTGPMNSSVANDFQSRFDRHRSTMNKLGTYNTNALDDEQLQIAPSDETQ